MYKYDTEVISVVKSFVIRVLGFNCQSQNFGISTFFFENNPIWVEYFRSTSETIIF